MATQRNDHSYVQKRDALKRKAKKENLPCWLCDELIDWDADWTSPMAFTADHVDPVAAGGSMTGELAVAHRSCNSRKGAKVDYQVSVTKPETRRQW